MPDRAKSREASAQANTLSQPQVQMMTSSRPRDVGDSFASRRGHSNQLSISDPSHHVTEAIGTMYGDSDDDSGPESRLDNPTLADSSRKSRPLSFLASPAGGEQIKSSESLKSGQRLVRSASDRTHLAVSTTATDPDANVALSEPPGAPTRMTSKRGKSYEGVVGSQSGSMSPISPNMSLRDVQEAESSQFPLGNIENPSDIAQELSNLQALRRMSMDVGNTSDPDLLPFSGISLVAMPTIAPTGEDDEGDISRLLWVPAQVHPELAPDQFKNFLEDRVKTIKRRSGETLSPDGMGRNNLASLRRKKSMLSRQVHSSGISAEDQEGFEKLARQTSAGGRATPELSINELVKDPTKVVQKLAQETQEAGSKGDMPILPVAPGMGLRRSTRTTYRKGGSIRSGDRLPFSKRVAARDADKDWDKDTEEQTAPPMPKNEHTLEHDPARVQTEPAPATGNFSRPMRPVRRQPAFQQDNVNPASPSSPASTFDPYSPVPSHGDDSPTAISPPGTSDRPKTSDSGRSTAMSVPQIVETPPPSTDAEFEQLPQLQSSRSYPQRSSSQKTMEQQQQSQQNHQQEPPAPRSLRRPPSVKQIRQQGSPKSNADQTLSDLAQHPSPLPGGSNTRTDALTFIPTMPADDRRKSKDENSSDSSKSTGWKWFRGEDREKKKREKEDQAKKSRSRTSGEKGASHGDARLDVLQSSIDTAIQKGRESLLLDSDSVDNKLHEERKKESSRAKSGESKKEKDGFFGSIFGGKTKKSDKDSSSSRSKQRALSPEPPPRPMRPDIDYPFTRFPIVEERAIYRMAHIKLANPRRPLLSQVLLSNFMYSYLAKVQAMHPQINVPVSPQQKRAEEERRRQEQEQQYMLQQQMAHEAEHDDGQGSYDQYGYDHHRSENQYGDYQGQEDGSVDYIDDSQIYEHDQQRNEHERHQNGGGYRGEQQNRQVDRPGSSGRSYYDYEQRKDERGRENEMW